MSNNEPPKTPPPTPHTRQHGGAGEEQWHPVRMPGAEQGSDQGRRPDPTRTSPDETPVEDPRTHTSGG
jgi:hypothetical protein